MHRIRYDAHRQASRVEGNWFGHARTRSNSDCRNHVVRTRSEGGGFQPTIEEQRRLESRQAEQEFPPPQHADTAPPHSATSAMSEGLPFSHEKGSAHDAPLMESVDGSDSAGVMGISSQTQTQSPPQTHHRKGIKAMFQEKSSAHDAPLKTDASDSTGVMGASSQTQTQSSPQIHRRKGLKVMFHRNRDGASDKSDEEAVLDTQPEEELSLEERKKKALKRKIPLGEQMLFFKSWIYILLLAVPVGFGVYYSHNVNPIGVFVINFVAIIPLAAMLSSATEDIAVRTGDTLGGLLNATFGNAVELIVSVQALIKNEIVIVKTSLVGSMLSNLLLVLGMSFTVGGYNRLEQHFNVTVAQTAASLLALCIASLIIPTVFHNMLIEAHTEEGQSAQKNQELSRGTAIILLFVYAMYLLFQLKTHEAMYTAPSRKSPKNTTRREKGDAMRVLAGVGVGTAAFTFKPKIYRDPDEEEEFETPQLSWTTAIVTLTISTVLVAFCSEFMVSSIEGVTATGGVSETFIGLILLPIVGNAAEHATAVAVAAKDKMDLSIGVAVGSSMQIALLVLPLVVVLGWIMGKDEMTLYFDTFQIAILFVAVLLVNYLIADGKSHWLEGVLLMSSYVIIALAAWFYPNTAENKHKG